MVHFPGFEYRTHTSCMTEEQKYQGALYRNKKAKTTQNASAPTSAPANKAMAHAAYVEDVADEYEAWRDYEQASDDNRSAASPPPEAPTPPSANEPNVNVFDYLIANPTPTASSLSLPATAPVQHNEDTQLVRFDYGARGLDELDMEDAMIQYSSGPVATNFQTPAPKGERKKAKHTESEIKKDKKRKRLHIETDQVMTDAPPVLHSGLTGGLNRLMSRPSVFPPSPDYSGGDGPEAETPASPLKKSKHSKHHKASRGEGIGNSIMAMIAGGPTAKPSKSKSSKKRKSSTDSTSKSSKKKSQKRLEAPKEQKLLEYRPGSKDSKEGDNPVGQMVVYKPRADHFLSFVSKGPESERGCSVNKALKRYHRERSESGTSLSKLMEEKELWRSLRMRKNERGEIVLFSI
ncbi:hypothetical protein B0T14DRAFT_420047 [Immersiella caudata]|uniref:Zinc finger C2H2 LYAR-type domain-containing protein n=1 Tax=Immersiella caudata TaxID=314043 RepID=A0AA39XDS6_9PEZI|nr:hypothetical protein B0T14DRAFT_420047 [Immersiella caudata]